MNHLRNVPNRASAAETPSDPDAVSHRAGVEWIVDAIDCDAGMLCDLSLLVRICQDVITDLRLSVIGVPQTHPFPPPGGVTALFMLSESHLACHTYPEYRLATFNLYCCRDRPSWLWQSELSRRLQASQVIVRRIERGLSLTANAGQRPSASQRISQSSQTSEAAIETERGTE